MEIEALTPKLLEDALRNFRQAQLAPVALLDLSLLQKPGLTNPIEKSLELETYINRIITSMLTRQRQAEELAFSSVPATRRELTAALTEDFQIGNPDLEAWSALYHRYLAPVPASVEELANAANVVPQQFRRRLNQGLAYLLEQVRRDEIEACQQQRNIPARYLPNPEYAKLYGVQSHIETLTQQLHDPEGPRFLSLEGLGGIGKTALARAVAQKRIQKGDLESILWISARQEWLSESGELIPLNDPVRSVDDVVARMAIQLGLSDTLGLSTQKKLQQIQRLLHTISHLVVIDNLETLADSEALIPALFPLANQSRFLLTSRQTLRRFPYVHIFPVPELSFADAQALIQGELERRGHFQNSQKLTERLYEVIGGLPLALKLAVSQIGCLPPTEIIENLQQARHQTPEFLYTFIYQRTWQLLSDSAQYLLLALLPLDSEGEDLDFIRILSKLPDTTFEEALNDLLNYSLIEVDNVLDCPHYRLHRMTTTFLQTNILQRWSSTKE